MDSGCWRHMTGNLKYLTSYKEKLGGRVIFGDNRARKIKGYGDLIKGNITIHKVHYVKGLHHNLLSLSQFMDNKFRIIFDDDVCTIFRKIDWQTILIAYRYVDLFVVDFSVATNPTTFCSLSKKKEEGWLWHKRFSHLKIISISQNKFQAGEPKKAASVKKSILKAKANKPLRDSTSQKFRRNKYTPQQWDSDKFLAMQKIEGLLPLPCNFYEHLLAKHSKSPILKKVPQKTAKEPKKKSAQKPLKANQKLTPPKVIQKPLKAKPLLTP